MLNPACVAMLSRRGSGLHNCERRGCRSELEARIGALSDQITQERASNKAALEDQRRCMAADNEKALADVETQAANHVQIVQQSTVKLQADVAEKITEISKLQSEYGPKFLVYVSEISGSSVNQL